MVTNQKNKLTIDKWDGNAMKNTLDDCVKQVLTERFSYTENHKLMNGRLLLCALAASIAGFALIWDYLHPFPKSRNVLIVCVVTYFLLSGLLTLYITYIEKGIFLVAHGKDPSKRDKKVAWKASSQLKRYFVSIHVHPNEGDCFRFDDKYSLQLILTSDKTSKAEFTKSVSCWFDEDGVFLADLFTTDVCMLHDGLLTSKKDK